jgi:hypothetical protein
MSRPSSRHEKRTKNKTFASGYENSSHLKKITRG